MEEKKEHRLVWLDMEMSGLNPRTDRILEVALLVTDSQLNIVQEGPELIIRQNSDLFNSMDDWNKEHHTKSGLWKSVLESHISLEQAEDQILRFLEDTVVKKKSPLCGNSIAQDRSFLAEYMPRVNEFLHYRMVDVSTLKELVKRWYPNGPAAPTKTNQHRAMEDIKESIRELVFYRDTFFISLGK